MESPCALKCFFPCLPSCSTPFQPASPTQHLLDLTLRCRVSNARSSVAGSRRTSRASYAAGNRRASNLRARISAAGASSAAMAMGAAGLAERESSGLGDLGEDVVSGLGSARDSHATSVVRLGQMLEGVDAKEVCCLRSATCRVRNGSFLFSSNVDE